MIFKLLFCTSSFQLIELAPGRKNIKLHGQRWRKDFCLLGEIPGDHWSLPIPLDLTIRITRTSNSTIKAIFNKESELVWRPPGDEKCPTWTARSIKFLLDVALALPVQDQPSSSPSYLEINLFQSFIQKQNMSNKEQRRSNEKQRKILAHTF